MRTLLVAALLFVGCAKHVTSDIVLYMGGVIHTGVARRGHAEALAVRNGRIMAVGKTATLFKAYPHAMKIDLKGACVVPGLIDAHGHLASLGASKLQLDLRNTLNYMDMIQQVRERAAQIPAGQWILGGRWDQASWGDKEFPHHRALSDLTLDHPVLLSRVDGHAALANRKAMELAGITNETKSPAGGEILRDKNGAPTGVFVDSAVALVRRVVPEGQGLPIGELWKIAQRACFAVGITSVHDAGVARKDIPELKKLYEKGALKLRAYVMLSDGDGMAEYLEQNEPLVGDRFSVRALKLYADGAMGSWGAWMLKPYSDRPTKTGNQRIPIERLRELATVAARTGWQVCTHAIGDRANREVLDAYAHALNKHPRRNHRFRIEHAQCISPEDIPRFGQLGVIASMQPTHATSDMRWAKDRVGPRRIEGCYAWRTLMSAGAHLAFGSDFPVENENPMLGLYAAVTRTDLVGNPAGGWRSGEKLSRRAALRLFTINAAYAAFMEKRIGSLETGKEADFVVLDRDIMTVHAEGLPGARVLRTVIAGETVYLTSGN